MSLWDAHLGEAGSLDGGAGRAEFQSFPADASDEQHEEPVERREARGREQTIRRHKDITQDDVELSNKLWRWGFFLLPFLWLVNYVFFRHALHQPTAPESMKTNIRRSLNAFGIAIAIWLIWLIVFYTNYKGWASVMLIFSPDTTVIHG